MRNVFAPVRRDKTPIDQDHTAILEFEGGQNPVSRPKVGDSQNLRFRLVEEDTGRSNAPVFVLGGADPRPFREWRYGNRSCVSPLRHPGDKIELPGAPFDLPSSECDKSTEQQKRAERCRRLLDPPCHGILRMSCIPCIEAGIILWFRWYMTHSEPLSAITTSMMVKSSANSVHPPSALVFIWRKYTI